MISGFWRSLLWHCTFPHWDWSWPLTIDTQQNHRLKHPHATTPMSSKPRGCFSPGSTDHRPQTRTYITKNFLPPQVHHIPHGTGIGQSINTIGKEKHRAIPKPEIRCGFGHVHRLVNDLEFLDVFVLLVVEVGVGWVDDRAQGGGLFDVLLGQQLVQALELLVRAGSHGWIERKTRIKFDEIL